MSNERRMGDLGEDATGFGAVEFHTLKESILRPRSVLEAYMLGSSTGDGSLSRPIRLYLLLCGVMMLVSFLMGGVQNQLQVAMPEGLLTRLLEISGKSRDAFFADADGWISLCLVPVLSLFFALGIAPLMRWWDPENLGWRRAFRATFAYLNAWTILLLPICWMNYYGPTVLIGNLIVIVLGLVTFVRMGRGRWFRTTFGGILKAVALAVAIQLAGAAGSGLVLMPIGMLGALYGA